MKTLLMLDEIKSEFQNEWVLVGEPQTNDFFEVLSGQILWHSKDRDEVYRNAIELRPKHFAMLFTGELPQNVDIIL